MSNEETQKNKLGPNVKRSSRNKWAEQHESLVRSLAPFPITYDVNQSQPTNFSEYTYTEFLNGLWVTSQSLEINCQMFEEASKYESTHTINLEDIVSDKYVSKDDNIPTIDRICFLPGHNALDIASVEMIARIAFEEDDVLFKPHPITNEEGLKIIAQRVGWHKVLPKEMSGNVLLKNCKELYTTSASEMAISGTILGKKVHNISNFFNEGSGAYYPISRILFKKHKTSIQAAQEALSNIIDCPWSGIILPIHDNIEERIKAFYSQSLICRNHFKPLAGPRGRPPAANNGAKDVAKR